MTEFQTNTEKPESWRKGPGLQLLLFYLAGIFALTSCGKAAEDCGNPNCRLAAINPRPAIEAVPVYSVSLIEPREGAAIHNPVTFRIESRNITRLQLFAGGRALGESWDPAVINTYTHKFDQIDLQTQAILRGYDAAGTLRAEDHVSFTVLKHIGDYLGQMWNTYYYVAMEADFSGSKDTVLYDKDCNNLAQVPSAFSDAVCIEGTGILEDGRLINSRSTCRCGRQCPSGQTICYAVLDRQEYPWGSGANDDPLIPLRSWAVDYDFLPVGTVAYVKQWDGVAIPAISGLGGFIHDGCFRVDDTSSQLVGNHYDFFSGSHSMFQALEAMFSTYTDFDVYINPECCGYLAPGTASP